MVFLYYGVINRNEVVFYWNGMIFKKYWMEKKMRSRMRCIVCIICIKRGERKYICLLFLVILLFLEGYIVN